MANSLRKYGTEKATQNMSAQEKFSLMQNGELFRIIQESHKIANDTQYGIVRLTVEDLKNDKWQPCERQQLWSFISKLIGGNGPYYKEYGKGIESNDEIKTVLKNIAKKEKDPSVKEIADKVIQTF